MNRAVEDSNRRLLRARDAMDRDYAAPLDVPALARIACVSDVWLAAASPSLARSAGCSGRSWVSRRPTAAAGAVLLHDGAEYTEGCPRLPLAIMKFGKRHSETARRGASRTS